MFTPGDGSWEEVAPPLFTRIERCAEKLVSLCLSPWAHPFGGPGYFGAEKFTDLYWEAGMST